MGVEPVGCGADTCPDDVIGGYDWSTWPELGQKFSDLLIYQRICDEAGFNKHRVDMTTSLEGEKTRSNEAQKALTALEKIVFVPCAKPKPRIATTGQTPSTTTNGQKPTTTTTGQKPSTTTTGDAPTGNAPEPEPARDDEPLPGLDDKPLPRLDDASDPGNAVLDIAIEQPKPCNVGQDCQFDFTIRNKGTGTYQGPVFFEVAIPGNWTPIAADISKDWFCASTTTGKNFCWADVNIGADTVSGWTSTFKLPRSVKAGAATCVNLMDIDFDEQGRTTALISALQLGLSREGYKIDRIDGIVGPKTDAALDAYFKDNLEDAGRLGIIPQAEEELRRNEFVFEGLYGKNLDWFRSRRKPGAASGELADPSQLHCGKLALTQPPEAQKTNRKTTSKTNRQPASKTTSKTTSKTNEKKTTGKSSGKILNPAVIELGIGIGSGLAGGRGSSGKNRKNQNNKNWNN
ncbi:MAG: hypothetical protein WBE01_03120 [Methyloceanibacter sp.]